MCVFCAKIRLGKEDRQYKAGAPVVSPLPWGVIAKHLIHQLARSFLSPFSFSPFNQVIEILSVSLDQDKDIDESPDFDQLADNPLHKNIQRQLQVCSDVVERITVEHHGSLNSSVQAMGGVARHYNQTRANVGTLREQLRECKQLLQTGSSQTDVRELWQRKLQYSLVLRLLNALDMIKVRVRRGLHQSVDN